MADNAPPLPYGQVFQILQGKDHVFADFRLFFVGRKPGTFFPGTTRRLGDIYEFRISSKTGEQLITWSSGTGELGPTAFASEGRCYLLELVFSERFGWLKMNEAVISLDRHTPPACK